MRSCSSSPFGDSYCRIVDPIIDPTAEPETKQNWSVSTLDGLGKNPKAQIVRQEQCTDTLGRVPANVPMELELSKLVPSAGALTARALALVVQYKFVVLDPGG